MAKQQFQTTLVTFRPRLGGDDNRMFRATKDKMVINNGHSIRTWKTGSRANPNHQLVSLIGQQTESRLAPGFQTVNVKDHDAKLVMDMLNRLAFTGSYVQAEEGRKPTLAYVEDDNNFYIKLLTGLFPNEVVMSVGGRDRTMVETESDFLELVRRGIKPMSHGFHDLGGTNSILASEAGITFAGAESKTLWSSASRDRVSGTDIPHIRTELIAMPKFGNPEGMFQDIDGSKGRIVIVNGRPDIVDADGKPYETFWAKAEERRRKAAVARREAKRLSKSTKDAPPAQPDMFQPTDAVSLDGIEAEASA